MVKFTRPPHCDARASHRHACSTIRECDARDSTLSFINRSTRVFLAYSHGDLRQARDVKRRLRKINPTLIVFLDQDSLKPTENIAIDAFDREISDCDLFICLCGRNTAGSLNIARELRLARDLQKTILAIKLGPNCQLPQLVEMRLDKPGIQAVFLTTLFPDIQYWRIGIASIIVCLALMIPVTAYSFFRVPWYSFWRISDLRVLKEEMPTGFWIHQAVLRNDDSAEALQRFSRLGGVNKRRTMDGRTPLHLAAEIGTEPLIPLLVGYDPAILEVQDIIGQTPIFLAAAAGHISAVRELKRLGADSNVRDRNGCTTLHVAARSGYVEVLRLLKDSLEIDIGDNDHRTPLYYAASEGRTSSVEFLLASGADVDIRDSDGRTALYAAIAGGNDEVQQLLLKANATLVARSSSEESILHVASKFGNANIAKKILEMGAAVDEKGPRERTALHIAAQLGHKEVFKVLLAHGASVDSRDEVDSTSLHLAAAERHNEIVSLLLEQGAIPGLIDRYGRNPLHNASTAGCNECISLLLERLQLEIDEPDIYGMTPLHLACKAGHLNSISKLIEHGADIDIFFQPEHGGFKKGAPESSQELCYGTPLAVSADRGQLEACRLLLEHGASIDFGAVNHAVLRGQLTVLRYLSSHPRGFDFDGPKLRSLLSSAANGNSVEIVDWLTNRLQGQRLWVKSEGNEHPLHEAAYGGPADIVAKLLDAGFDVDERYTEHGITPIFQAIRSCNRVVFDLLIARGAQIDASIAGGLTPLQEAAFNGSPEMLEFLLNKTKNLTAEGNGTTPLHGAVASNRQMAVKILLDRGASPNSLNIEGESPLFLASKYNFPHLVTMLLSHGAVVHPDGANGSALHVAAESGATRVVELLLKAGADATARNNDEETPLHRAAWHGETGVIKTLIENGTSIDAQDYQGMTPLFRAAERGQTNVVALLLRNGAKTTGKDRAGRTLLQLIDAAEAELGSIFGQRYHEIRRLIDPKTLPRIPPTRDLPAIIPI